MTFIQSLGLTPYRQYIIGKFFERPCLALAILFNKYTEGQKWRLREIAEQKSGYYSITGIETQILLCMIHEEYEPDVRFNELADNAVQSTALEWTGNETERDMAYEEAFNSFVNSAVSTGILLRKRMIFTARGNDQ